MFNYTCMLDIGQHFISVQTKILIETVIFTIHICTETGTAVQFNCTYSAIQNNDLGTGKLFYGTGRRFGNVTLAICCSIESVT